MKRQRQSQKFGITEKYSVIFVFIRGIQNVYGFIQ